MTLPAVPVRAAWASTRSRISTTVVSMKLPAVQVGEPGFYGRIDIGNFPQPQVVYPQPVVIQPVPVGVVRQPIYLRELFPPELVGVMLHGQVSRPVGSSEFVLLRSVSIAERVAGSAFAVGIDDKLLAN